ncbi:MAG: hypothetical protein RLZZ616_569 [Pseudomonadota bacterium]
MTQHTVGFVPDGLWLGATADTQAGDDSCT